MTLRGIVSPAPTAGVAAPWRAEGSIARIAIGLLAGGLAAAAGWATALGFGTRSATTALYPAALVSAWLGGARAAVLTTLGCVLFAWSAHGGAAPSAEATDLAAFAAVGVAIGALGELRLRARVAPTAAAKDSRQGLGDGRLRVLEQLTAALTGASTRERLAESIVSAARQVLGAELVLVRFFVETRPFERASPPAGAGWSRRREEDARAAIECAERAGAAVVLRAHEHDASARGLGAIVAVPLVVGEHASGGIAIAFEDSDRASPADVELMSAFGAECALLLDRCRVLETEAALRARAEASEALFRLVAEHAPDLVFRLRLTPVPGFDYVSPSALELTGHRPEEFYADPTLALALLHVEDRGRLARLGDGSGDPVELRWWRRDGGMCWSEVRSACVLDANGRIVALEGIARDVTSRKRREIERESAYALEHEARARAESAARAREDLLAMVSHDLRTPLNTVTLGARMAIEALTRGDDPESLERRLGSIRHAAERMGRLVAQLLDAASIEAGRFSLTPEHVDAEGLVREALDLVAPSAAEKRVELRSEVGPAVAVACDRERVLQVLANLLGNAIKFTPSGGRVELRVETDAAWASFSVCDTGPGIPEQQLPLIFDRYWTGRLQRTAGTGLGLFIAKGIVEAHTGRLVVDSRVGVGSTFTFTLPRLPR